MLRSFFASLRTRVILLVLLAILPASWFLLRAAAEQRRHAVADVQADAMLVARDISYDQSQLIEETHQLLDVLSELPELHGADPVACKEPFGTLLKQYQLYFNLSVLTPGGDVICSAQPLRAAVNVADRAYFRQAVETHDFTVSDYLIDRVTGNPVLAFADPVVTNDGSIDVILSAVLDLNWLNQLAAEMQLPADATFTLIGYDGIVLARYPDPESWVGQSVTDTPLLRAVLRQPAGGTTETTDLAGSQHLIAFAPLSGLPGAQKAYVVVGTPVENAFAAVNRMLAHNLIGLWAVAVLALAVAWYGGDLLFLRQIRALTNATRRMEAGDLSARAGLSYGSGELSQLAYAFDSMAATLDQRTAQLRQAEAKYRELVEQIPAVVYVGDLDQPGAARYVSPQIQAILGYTPAEWTAAPDRFRQRLHRNDRERVLAEMAHSRDNGGIFQAEYRLLAADDRVVWIHDEASVVRDTVDGARLLQGIMLDITDRVWAEEEIRRRAAHQEALNAIIATATATLDLKALLETALAQILQALKLEMGAIWVADCYVQRGLPPESGPMMTKAAQAAGPETPRLSAPLVVEDWQQVAASIRWPWLVPLMARLGIRASLTVPILFEGQYSGGLTLVVPEPRRWRGEEIALVEAAGRALGVAAERLRLLAETQRRLEEVTLLSRVIAHAASAEDVSTALQAVCAELARFFGAPQARFARLNPERTAGVVIAEYQVEGRPSALGACIPVADNPSMAHVLEHRLPLAVTDAQTDPRLAPVHELLRQQEVASILIVPIVSRGEVVGTLGLDSLARREFSEAEVTLTQHVASQVRQILERLELIEEIERSEQKYRLLVENQTDLVVKVDLQWRFQFVSPSYCELFGKREAELLGKTFMPLVHEDDREATAKAMEALYAPPYSCYVEQRAYTKDGWRWLAWADKAVLAPDGSVAAIVGVGRDITQRVQADDELRRLYSEAQQHAHEMEILNRVGQRLTATLSQAEIVEHLGREAGDLLRAGNFSVILYDEARGELAQKFYLDHGERKAGAVFPLGEGLTSFIISRKEPILVSDYLSECKQRGVEPAGIGRPAKAWLGVPIIALDKALGALLVWDYEEESSFGARDLQILSTLAAQAAIAFENARLYDQVRRYAEHLEARVAKRTEELQAANEALRQAAEELRELNRFRSQFVSNVSHELRTPLTNFRLLLGLLAKGRPEKREGYLATLGREADILDMLITELLYLSRMDLGKVQLVKEELDINQIVAELCGDRSELLAARGLTLAVQLAPALHPVSADRKMLIQVLTNLMTNAMNYTPRGGRITVKTESLERDGKAWMSISVSDTGPGISPEDQAHLFERFYRGEAARQSGASGTGLGLAICQEIMARHDGEITVESQEGAGSTFMVWLPIADQTAGDIGGAERDPI